MDFVVRFRIYLTLTAAAPLLVYYGAVTSTEAALWLGLAGSALGNGLAAINAHNWRVWIYGIAGSVAGLVSGYGIASEVEVSLWLTVLAVALGVAGTSTAARFTRDPS